MFSQFRNAVEQLAQQPARILEQTPTADNQTEAPSRSQSLDIRANPSQLAESAISSLRKSFVSQRSNGFPPTNAVNAPSSSSSPGGTSAPRPKSNLEERLRRATYAIGDAGQGSKPSPSPAPSRTSDRASGSPSPMSRVPMKPSHRPSPASTPLPGSPVITPAREPQVPAPTDFRLNKQANSPGLKTDVPQLTDLVPKEKPKEQAPSVPESSTTTTDTQRRNSVEALKSEEDVKPPTQYHESNESSDKVATASDSKEDVEASKPAGDAASSPPVDASEHMAEVETTKTEENSNSSSSDEDSNTLDSGKEMAAATVENPVEVTTQTTLQASESNDGKLAAEAPSSGQKQIPLHVDVIEALVENLAMNTSVNASPVPKSPNLIGIDPEEPVSPSSYLPPTELEPEHIKEVINRVLLEKSILTEPISTLPTKDQSSEVEALQARLRQIEQRFSDVSTSFKRLQAEKQAADAVLREVSPLESIKDTDALREFFAELKTKDQVFQDEIKRLNQKLEAQEDRMEAIHATHEQQIRTLTDEKQKIRTQLDETEKLFAATQAASAQAEDASDAQKEDVSRLQREVEVQKTLAKEEEEKRVKAISLLKTVRQKLVKAEKDREDVLKEMAAVKEREKGDRSKEEALKQSLQQEMEKLSVNHDRTVATLRSQFDKDFASVRERYEQEIAALRGQSELDIATLKSTHSKELNAKANLITTLESTINKVTQDKNEFFDSLQMRQAELESAQSHLESLQHQNTELQFQLRESNERLALLKEEVAELMREQDSRIREPVISADEITRMVTATEAKYEARLAEAQRRLATMEKERYESEADWSRKLREKVKDLEELRRILGTANKSRENDESVVASLKEQLSQEKNALKALQNQIAQLPLLKENIIELEKSVQEQEKELSIKNQLLERQIEESKAREAQLKQSNKSLKDELRKVQSSAALLERQRNPGVGGYWGNRGESSTGNGSAVSLPSVGETPSRVSSPAPTSSSGKQEEEVNLEYLRNVILQFLEHKEMRPNLVRVLSIILHFTPQETRRLIAKV